MAEQPPIEFADPDLGTPYREGILALAPSWLVSDARYLYSQGVQRDGIAEWFRLGILQRFPDYTDANGLAALGRDRGIFRGRTETDDAYAVRLRQYIATWRLAGNAPTLLRQLWALLNDGSTVRIRYVVNGYDGNASDVTQFADWWTIDETGLSKVRASPSNWDWDGDSLGYGKQARFWLIVYRLGFTIPKWGDDPPGLWGAPGWYWGTSEEEVSWIRDLYDVVRAFRAAGSALGPWLGFGGGLIIADPNETSSPWGAGGPFDPSLPPGYPMPDGDFNIPASRPSDGALYLSGL